MAADGLSCRRRHSLAGEDGIQRVAQVMLLGFDPALAITRSAHGRLSTALLVAGQSAPASVLAAQAKIRVKQGVCHQLANADRVTWKV